MRCARWPSATNWRISLLRHALALQSRTGGGLTEALDGLADVMRKRLALSARGLALAAEAKTSIIILASLPFVSGSALAVLNPQYIGRLFHEPASQKVLLAAIGMLGRRAAGDARHDPQGAGMTPVLASHWPAGWLWCSAWRPCCIATCDDPRPVDAVARGAPCQRTVRARRARGAAAVVPDRHRARRCHRAQWGACPPAPWRSCVRR